MRQRAKIRCLSSKWRRGWSIAEVVLAITILTLTLNVMTPWLARMGEQARSLERDIRSDLTLLDLRDRLKQDARDAFEAKHKDQELALRSSDGGAIVWQFAGDSILRRTVPATGTASREFFALPLHSSRITLSDVNQLEIQLDLRRVLTKRIHETGSVEPRTVFVNLTLGRRNEGFRE